jgi:hypothetical protein
MVADAKAKLEAANLPGYTKVVRTVCKAEWAYEVRAPHAVRSRCECRGIPMIRHQPALR